jgi:hypothetical protein
MRIAAVAPKLAKRPGSVQSQAIRKGLPVCLLRKPSNHSSCVPDWNGDGKTDEIFISNQFYKKDPEKQQQVSVFQRE